jgi:exopolysaccharide biosynthesis polyprenyl glycosylphosphotransferase
MFSHRSPLTPWLVGLADVVGAALSFRLVFEVRYRLPPGFLGRTAIPGSTTHLEILFLGLPTLLLVLAWFGAYDVGRFRTTGEIARSVLKAYVLAGLVVFSLPYLLRDIAASRAVIIGTVCLSSLSSLAIRILARRVLEYARSRGYNQRRALIVGLGSEAEKIAGLLEQEREQGLRVVGFVADAAADRPPPGLPLMGSVDELLEILEREVVDDLVFVLPTADLMRYEPLLGQCEELGKTIHLKVDPVRSLISRTSVGELCGVPILTLRSAPPPSSALLLKRVFDVALSAGLLVLLAPLILLITAGIRLSSPGPVFYRQKRLGLNGRTFTLLKFRSMEVGADDRLKDLLTRNELDGPAFKIRRDPRVFAFGAFLRRYSLDELPQLVNVLKGEMSLVGPRPPIPREVKQYQRWQRRRLSMKPGLTGLWQVSGRNEVDFEEWMRMDMEYIDNWSLGLDLRILLRTIPAVFLARGAS